MKSVRLIEICNLQTDRPEEELRGGFLNATKVDIGS